MAAPSAVLVGPKSDMAITPKKKPNVAPKSAEDGVPFIFNCDFTIMFVKVFAILFIISNRPVFRSVDITE